MNATEDDGTFWRKRSRVSTTNRKRPGACGHHDIQVQRTVFSFQKTCKPGSVLRPSKKRKGVEIFRIVFDVFRRVRFHILVEARGDLLGGEERTFAFIDQQHALGMIRHGHQRPSPTARTNKNDRSRRSRSTMPPGRTPFINQPAHRIVTDYTCQAGDYLPLCGLPWLNCKP